MSLVVNLILFAALGVALASAGCSVNTWQYWVILVCAVCIGINAALW